MSNINKTNIRRSIVQVRFPGWNKTLAYYNDSFDLHPGDKVYVSGKLEGTQGIVTEVSYSFKIKLSDYHRIISKADTDVRGEFITAYSHMVSFDRNALPREQARTWFLPPAQDEDVISGSDGNSFTFDDLSKSGFSAAVAERGHNIYMQNGVLYISLDGTHGYAIVEGSRAPYEVEFEYLEGEIKDITCSCFCSDRCKHQFAAILQLKETLDAMSEHFEDEYSRAGYFAAINTHIFINNVVAGKNTLRIALS